MVFSRVFNRMIRRTGVLSLAGAAAALMSAHSASADTRGFAVGKLLPPEAAARVRGLGPWCSGENGLLRAKR